MPHRKQIASALQRQTVVLFRQISLIAVYSENLSKPITNTFSGKNANFFNVKVGGTYSNHLDLKCYGYEYDQVFYLHYRFGDPQQPASQIHMHLWIHIERISCKGDYKKSTPK
jgi:hypothetical protein